MKLLLDQNISFRVAKHFKNSDLNIIHANEVDLNNASDAEIWNYARSQNCSIVTFDADFYDLQLLKGFPPKIIWLRFGNTTRRELITNFEKHAETINNFCESKLGCLELY